jgi:Tyrosine decarboxylase, C-terminal
LPAFLAKLPAYQHRARRRRDDAASDRPESRFAARVLIVRPDDSGVVFRTRPPDTNIFCFVVNRAGNTSLTEMNRIHLAIYDELKFNPESVIQRHNFIISSTALTFNQYGPKGSQRIDCLDEHLAALGIPAEEFEKVGCMKTLRPAVTSPWLALSRV